MSMSGILVLYVEYFILFVSISRSARVQVLILVMAVVILFHLYLKVCYRQAPSCKFRQKQYRVLSLYSELSCFKSLYGVPLCNLGFFCKMLTYAPNPAFLFKEANTDDARFFNYRCFSICLAVHA